MPHNKRPNYFSHQFLDEKDFQDEQQYHLDHRRLHNRTLHKWGVVEGLVVEARGAREVVVQPGVAIDRDGREVVLAESATREVPSGQGEEAFVTITYHEHFHKEDAQSGGGEGTENFRRVTELPEVHVRRQVPPSDGSVLELARVRLDSSGNIREVDLSNRVHGGAILTNRAVTSENLADESVTRHKLAAGAVTTPKIADEAITAEKLAERSVSAAKLDQELRNQIRSGGATTKGWVRCVFKPSYLEPREESEAPRSGGGVVRFKEAVRELTGAGAFVVELTHSYSGAHGGRGSMCIPVPPGATKILAMRVTGLTRSRLEARLVKIGWNSQSEEPESLDLITEMVETPQNEAWTPFHRHTAVPRESQQLRTELDAVAISVTAHGESRVWLVAAEFE